MTKEEIITQLEDLACDAKGRIDPEDPKDVFRKDSEALTEAAEILKAGVPVIYPISREQVEKVFPGCQSCKSCRSCVFSIHQLRDQPCKKCDPNAECALTEYKPSNFCPICGKPLTDEAVQMVIKRLEALKDGKGD